MSRNKIKSGAPASPPRALTETRVYDVERAEILDDSRRITEDLSRCITHWCMFTTIMYTIYTIPPIYKKNRMPPGHQSVVWEHILCDRIYVNKRTGLQMKCLTYPALSRSSKTSSCSDSLRLLFIVKYSLNVGWETWKRCGKFSNWMLNSRPK